MVQVKLFESTSTQLIENELNQFLRDHIITVIDIKMSHSTATPDDWLTLLLIYEP